MLNRTLKPGEWVTLYRDGKPVASIKAGKSSGNRLTLVLELAPETQATHDATPAPTEQTRVDRLRPRI
jgi:antitoxin (DNA-binding transcriptional repressor) of toxin-antitoxin stability system